MMGHPRAHLLKGITLGPKYVEQSRSIRWTGVLVWVEVASNIFMLEDVAAQEQVAVAKMVDVFVDSFVDIVAVNIAGMVVFIVSKVIQTHIVLIKCNSYSDVKIAYSKNKIFDPDKTAKFDVRSIHSDNIDFNL